MVRLQNHSQNVLGPPQSLSEGSSGLIPRSAKSRFCSFCSTIELPITAHERHLVVGSASRHTNRNPFPKLPRVMRTDSWSGIVLLPMLRLQNGGRFPSQLSKAGGITARKSSRARASSYRKPPNRAKEMRVLLPRRATMSQETQDLETEGRDPVLSSLSTRRRLTRPHLEKVLNSHNLSNGNHHHHTNGLRLRMEVGMRGHLSQP